MHRNKFLACLLAVFWIATMQAQNVVVTPDSCHTAACDGTAMITGLCPNVLPDSIVWSNGQHGFNATGLCADTSYWVRVYGPCGCDSLHFYVGLSAPYCIATVEQQNCQPLGTVRVWVDGGMPPYAYTWTNGLGQVIGHSDHLDDMPAGVYEVLVTDALGCTSWCQTEVVATTQPSISVLATPTICGKANGSVMTTVTGGVAPFFYDWSNDATTADQTGLASGYYQVTLTDKNGCTAMTGSMVNSSQKALDTLVCAMACEAITLFGQVYTETKKDTITQFIGECPRNVYIQFTLLDSGTSDTLPTIQACWGSLSFGGQPLTSDTILVITGVGQCDGTFYQPIKVGNEPLHDLHGDEFYCANVSAPMPIHVHNVSYIGNCPSIFEDYTVWLTPFDTATLPPNIIKQCGRIDTATYTTTKLVGCTKVSQEIIFVPGEMKMIKVVWDTIFECSINPDTTLISTGPSTIDWANCSIIDSSVLVIKQPIILVEEFATVCDSNETVILDGIARKIGVYSYFVDQAVGDNSRICEEHRFVVTLRPKVTKTEWFQVCEGEVITYVGQTLDPGLNTIILPTHSTNECDTTVYVFVEEFDAHDSLFLLTSCYQRADSIAIGYTQQGCQYQKRYVFVWQPESGKTVIVDTCNPAFADSCSTTIVTGPDGCQSVVDSIWFFQVIEEHEDLFLCWLLVPDVLIYTWVDLDGCAHRLVVHRYPKVGNRTDLDARQLCPGEMVEFEDQWLGPWPAGTLLTLQKIYESPDGCQDTVRKVITVTHGPTKCIDLEVCPGEERQFMGQFLQGGVPGGEPAMYQFVLPSQVGCDTVLTVKVATSNWSANLGWGTDTTIVFPTGTTLAQAWHIVLAAKQLFRAQTINGTDTITAYVTNYELVDDSTGVAHIGIQTPCGLLEGTQTVHIQILTEPGNSGNETCGFRIVGANPAALGNSIPIELKGFGGTISITLTSVSGNEVSRWELPATSGIQSFNILSPQGAGLYRLTIKDDADHKFSVWLVWTN